ncbi:N-acetylglucosaminyl-phosphatidylinositol de-N-acetylase-like [Schistocerca gregaria]|uniref:N-acetylglucosaminyl-phosphatidylinositol de-N-acetylase-like n=1 Tax=Schistocerca gregaria TaxID=7010 RepID=UPI00211E1E3E|nr:N-acetylglucosaminyl-phosphatidylinositol de-N-acetylase-like [Schistocerca gregaria]
MIKAADTRHIGRFKSDLGLTESNEPINILYVTAHPDDETMFFSPSILTLQTFQWYPDIDSCSGSQWDPEQVARHISESVDKWDINVLITFDSYGVSGHSNHISCYLGVEHYLKHFSRRRLVAYRLKSVSLLQKYCWPLGLRLFNPFQKREQNEHSSPSIKFFNPKPSATLYAMELHESQLVWFRRIYMSLSQYVHWNELEKIEGC